MELVKKFCDPGADVVSLCGGKGASLGAMTKGGIPVPPGFVVLTSGYDLFMELSGVGNQISRILQSLDFEDIKAVEEVSGKIGDMIMKAGLPEGIIQSVNEHFKELNAVLVAVRSSASAEDSAENAWAGQLETWLGTTSSNLLTNIKKCWCSLFSPRALTYMYHNNLTGRSISVAVVVQEMVDSDVAGVAFSVHPVTEDHDELIIEAGYGLGEAVVSGSITPDSYVVKKSTMQVTETWLNTQERALYLQPNGGCAWTDIAGNLGESQKLGQESILNLAEIVIQIEKFYGFPCDIEWAFSMGKWYILQCRPITTLT